MMLSPATFESSANVSAMLFKDLSEVISHMVTSTAKLERRVMQACGRIHGWLELHTMAASLQLEQHGIDPGFSAYVAVGLKGVCSLLQLCTVIVVRMRRTEDTHAVCSS